MLGQPSNPESYIETQVLGSLTAEYENQQSGSALSQKFLVSPGFK